MCVFVGNIIPTLRIVFSMHLVSRSGSFFLFVKCGMLNVHKNYAQVLVMSLLNSMDCPSTRSSEETLCHIRSH